MKKLMTVAMALCVTMVVCAQRGHSVGRTRVIVVSPSIGYGYSPFYYSPFGYNAFGYYPYGSPYGYGSRRPSKLDMKVEDIKADYKDKIKSARQDKSLARDERKKIIRELKDDRDREVKEARANYYKPKKAPVAEESRS